MVSLPIFSIPSYVFSECELIRARWKDHPIGCCKPRIGAIREQLKQIPEDASHVVISVGGNNATGASSTVLGEPVTDCEEATCSWEPYPDLSCSKSSEKNHTLYDFYSWIFILYAIQQALARLHDFAVTFEADFAAEMMLGVFKE